MLRERLAEGQKEKAQLEQRLHAAQVRYEAEVAPLREEVLRLQVERRRTAAQMHMRSARHRNAYHDAQQAYDDFRARPRPSEPSQNLKETYRAASKRCHPDRVPRAYRDAAAATFQALEAAYRAEHGAAVQAIATALRRWGFPTEESASTPRREQALRQAVDALEASVQALRETETYQALDEAASLDAFIEARKQRLVARLRDLDGARR
jgi:hypothetical protein